ncbi:MAG TPA: hypothetical protein VFC86_00950 [Planctomycetota bacterium]|nr:hypothetical protein [Planctomycetota bacterium]
MSRIFLSASLVILGLAPAAAAAQSSSDPTPSEERESPFLVVPTLTQNPKLGFSLGAIGAYLHYFDDKSRASLFGVSAQYSSTASKVAAAFGRASFGEDCHRAILLIAGGEIRNDYNDFLGTGVEVKSSDELRAAVGRYLYRAVDDWFVGLQGISTNYHIVGESAFDDQVLDVLGLQGFRSAGVGAAIYHDSRDSEDSPTNGWLLNANNIAYRDAFGGEENFDVYRLDNRLYVAHGEGHVLAFRQYNQWTVDAPSSAFAPVQLRGYKMGQYLGENMSSFEVEERYRLSERWTATIFAGVAFLYGNGQSLYGSDTSFPNAGAGVQYVLKRREGIVVNLEYAVGKDDNYGFYIKLGYGF